MNKIELILKNPFTAKVESVFVNKTDNWAHICFSPTGEIIYVKTESIQVNETDLNLYNSKIITLRFYSESEFLKQMEMRTEKKQFEDFLLQKVIMKTPEYVKRIEEKIKSYE